MTTTSSALLLGGGGAGGPPGADSQIVLNEEAKKSPSSPRRASWPHNVANGAAGSGRFGFTRQTTPVPGALVVCSICPTYHPSGAATIDGSTASAPSFVTGIAVRLPVILDRVSSRVTNVRARGHFASSAENARRKPSPSRTAVDEGPPIAYTGGAPI